jgi:hypothetical protein
MDMGGGGAEAKFTPSKEKQTSGKLKSVSSGFLLGLLFDLES